MKALVVGANGFIASHLVDELARRGDEVVAFDRYSRGPRYAKADNVFPFPGDFLNHADLKRAVAGVDTVFHFLSTSTPITAENDPTLDLRTNVAQTVDFLHVCATADVRKLFYASSGGAIYGDKQGASSSEDDVPLPISPYAIGKLTVENYLRYFEVKFGLRSTALRISNPYGPGQSPMRPQGLIPIVLRAVRNGNPIKVFGEGTMVRDYIDVRDISTLVSRLLDKEAKHDLYNIGAGAGFSVNEVLDIVREVTQQDFEIEKVAKPSTFVEYSVLDMSRYREEFGSIPTRSLRDGIRDTWAELANEDLDSGLI